MRLEWSMDSVAPMDARGCDLPPAPDPCRPGWFARALESISPAPCPSAASVTLPELVSEEFVIGPLPMSSGTRLGPLGCISLPPPRLLFRPYPLPGLQLAVTTECLLKQCRNIQAPPDRPTCRHSLMERCFSAAVPPLVNPSSCKELMKPQQVSKSKGPELELLTCVKHLSFPLDIGQLVTFSCAGPMQTVPTDIQGTDVSTSDSPWMNKELDPAAIPWANTRELEPQSSRVSKTATTVFAPPFAAELTDRLVPASVFELPHSVASRKKLLLLADSYKPKGILAKISRETFPRPSVECSNLSRTVPQVIRQRILSGLPLPLYPTRNPDLAKVLTIPALRVWGTPCIQAPLQPLSLMDRNSDEGSSQLISVKRPGAYLECMRISFSMTSEASKIRKCPRLRFKGSAVQFVWCGIESQELDDAVTALNLFVMPSRPTKRPAELAEPVVVKKPREGVEQDCDFGNNHTARARLAHVAAPNQPKITSINPACDGEFLASGGMGSIAMEAEGAYPLQKEDAEIVARPVFCSKVQVDQLSEFRAAKQLQASGPAHSQPGPSVKPLITPQIGKADVSQKLAAFMRTRGRRVHAAGYCTGEASQARHLSFRPQPSTTSQPPPRIIAPKAASPAPHQACPTKPQPPMAVQTSVASAACPHSPTLSAPFGHCSHVKFASLNPQEAQQLKGVLQYMEGEMQCKLVEAGFGRVQLGSLSEQQWRDFFQKARQRVEADQSEAKIYIGLILAKSLEQIILSARNPTHAINLAGIHSSLVQLVHSRVWNLLSRDGSNLRIFAAVSQFVRPVGTVPCDLQRIFVIQRAEAKSTLSYQRSSSKSSLLDWNGKPIDSQSSKCRQSQLFFKQVNSA